jgi:hypothetical protein
MIVLLGEGYKWEVDATERGGEVFGDGGEEEELCGVVVALLLAEDVGDRDCGVLEEEAVADEDPLQGLLVGFALEELLD